MSSETKYYKLVISKKRCVVIAVGKVVSVNGEISVVLSKPAAKIITKSLTGAEADSLLDALENNSDLTPAQQDMFLPEKYYELVRIIAWD